MSTEPLTQDGRRPDDLLTLENQVCFGLAVAARSVIGLYRPVLEPLSLTHPQYLVMLALWEREPRSVRNLSDTLALEPATLSPLLKRLEATGYVERRRSTADERALEVRLTEAGRELRTAAEKVPRSIVAQLGLHLSELEELRDSLQRITAAALRDD
jgi:DNA-binding MarR family transcriptional regulator